MASPKTIIDFWFQDLKPSDWWKKNRALDLRIESEFSEVLKAGKQGELYAWRSTPVGRLAEIIVLDQFSRNIYRGSEKAFEADSMALALAQEAHQANANQYLDSVQVPFLYMPFMHSESKVIHHIAEELFREIPALINHLPHELDHKAIIDRFGRYPHRNSMLGRESSADEIEFLKGPGSTF